MEYHLACTGFCFPMIASAQADANNATAAASLLQTGLERIKATRRAPVQHHFRSFLHKVHSLSSLQQIAQVEDKTRFPTSLEGVASERSHGLVSNATESISAATSPPYLFGTGTTAISCDAMAARKIKHAVGDAARAYFWLGVTVVCIWMCVTSMQFLGAFTAKGKRVA
eukprot:1912131-Amphidinium_carterae.3